MGIYYGTAHRQADAHIAAVAAGLLRAGAHPVKYIFHVVAVQSHTVILYPYLRLIIAAAGCQQNARRIFPMQMCIRDRVKIISLYISGT